jgi:hypothetical protein
MKDNLKQKISSEAVDYIEKYVDLDSANILVISTTNPFNLFLKSNNNAIINLSRINNIRYINKFFEAINEKLDTEGYYIGCVETITARRNRKRLSKVPLIGSLYFSFEFIFLRFFPKIVFLKTIYFKITRGRNRLLSKAETLGRLVSCGFEIENYETFEGLLYFVAKKKTAPLANINPSYGLFYRMPRVGKNKKTIGIYKLRTMHPYSEFLQAYMYSIQGTSNGDKANDDFRVTKWGKFFRKFWIDELPMIINLLRGEVKIIGVRPLSIPKFDMYPDELQEKRTQFKPGLIPPFYSDLPESFEELIKSENNYLDAYKISPLKTDFIYFFSAIRNIIFKGARSK